MKTVAFALAVSVALAVPALAPAADTAAGKDPIAWEGSYATASKKAEAEGKPLVLKFYTGWCPFCTKMEKTTWLDASVVEASKGFVCGKVNADVEAPAVARYRTTGYPTVIVAEPGGEPVARMEGYKDAATVAGVLRAYVERKDALATAVATLKKDKKDVPAQLTLADFQAGAGLNEQAADAYLKLTKSTQGGDFVRASAGAGLCMTRAGKAEQASKVLSKALETAGQAPTPALMLALGENEKALGRADQAKVWLGRVVAEHPASPEAAAAKKALGGA